MAQRPMLRLLTAAEEEDEEQDEIVLQYLVAELSRDPIVSPAVMQQVVVSATAAVNTASEALHSCVPAFKNEMSTSILSGNIWIHEALTHQNPRYMPELFVIDAAGFQKLVHDLGLEDGSSVSKELQLAMFLQVVRQTQHLRSIGDRDQRAKDTISKYFKLVLETLANRDGFYAKQVVMPTAADPPPPQLSQEPRFAGYFDGCIGAIDGTHLPIMRKATGPDKRQRIDWRAFRDRHGLLSWNTLAICDWDLRFLYILPAWEGSANDARLWDYATATDLVIPPGRWLLADAGFPACDELLTPYVGVRYHLQEWKRWRDRMAAGAQYVRDDEELFNLRHASTRNAVERIFGVLKRRFPILDTAPQYSISVQGLLLPGLAALHNWLRKYNNADLEAEVVREEDEAPNPDWPGATVDSDEEEEEQRRLAEWQDNRPKRWRETGPQRLKRVCAQRKALSKRMWADKIREGVDDPPV